MDDLAGWIASAATLIAAVMTAANLGARITGFGFAVFAIGSVAWCVLAARTGQDSLLWTNAFLLVVNAAGVWRWLGREAAYEHGRRRAARRSRRLDEPTLFSAASVLGGPVLGPDGRTLGRLVDFMIRGDDLSPGYMVVTTGGVAGVGEEVRALPPDMLRFVGDEVRCTGGEQSLARCPRLVPDNWPARLPATE